MAGFIQNIIWNSVEGFVEAGTRTAGEYAGNALIKAGDMVENGGRGMGNSIERRATAYGSAISGQTYKPSPKPLPSTARKPVIKRSNSLPASTKPNGTKLIGNTSKTPLGGNKYPGKNPVNGATSTAKKTLGGAQRSIPPFKGPASTTGSATKSLPKPFPSNTSGARPFGGSEKKTAVTAGRPKAFVPPVEKKAAEKKAYPGQGSRVPVQQQKMKALPRLGPQVGEGQKMMHIAV
ncbi:hypothetical protein IQ07DRAFT_586431 [Pyrenochaeta sp. DS3sAY3a]|nr:hypothetical protein IQ07DRAFT_586431 [Pyrenochaeta sp. DS3sAY3a]